MTPFEIAYQYIQDDVNRPDLVDMIGRRIQRSVIKQHRRDDWVRDTVEKPIVFPDQSSFVQQIGISGLPRFRKVRYLRRLSADSAQQAGFDPNPNYLSPDLNLILGAGLYTTAGPFFREKAPENANDYFGFDENDVYYRSGDQLKCYSSNGIGAVLLGYFADPVITPIENCTSWILSQFPNLIAADVKMYVFKIIGKDEESRLAKEEYQEEILTISAANVRSGLT